MQRPHVTILTQVRLREVKMPRKMQPPPPDAPISVLAAHAFHSALHTVLGPTTQAVAAEAVGETVQGYSDCLRGHRGSLDRVHGWVRAIAPVATIELNVAPHRVTALTPISRVSVLGHQYRFNTPVSWSFSPRRPSWEDLAAIVDRVARGTPVCVKSGETLQSGVLLELASTVPFAEIDPDPVTVIDDAVREVFPHASTGPRLRT